MQVKPGQRQRDSTLFGVNAVQINKKALDPIARRRKQALILQSASARYPMHEDFCFYASSALGSRQHCTSYTNTASLITGRVGKAHRPHSSTYIKLRILRLLPACSLCRHTLCEQQHANDFGRCYSADTGYTHAHFNDHQEC